MAYLPIILLSLVALFSGITVLSLVIGLRASREHRNTIFPMVREMQGIRTRQMRVASAVFLVLTGLTIGGWLATQQDPANVLQARNAPEQDNASAPIVQAEQSAQIDPVSQNDQAEQAEDAQVVLTKVEVLEEADAVSKVDAAIAQAVGATPEADPQPAVASAVTAPVSEPPLVASSIEVDNSPQDTEPQAQALTLSSDLVNNNFDGVVPDEVSLGPITFAASISDEREAIAPTDTFDEQPSRIYAVFPYSGMQNGWPFSVVWYYEGEEIVRDELEWSWGKEDLSYIYVNPPGAGTYELELKVGPEVIATGDFEIEP